MSLLEDILRKSQCLEDQLLEDRVVLRSVDLLFGLWVKNEEAATLLRARDELLNSNDYQLVMTRVRDRFGSCNIGSKQLVWYEVVVEDGKTRLKMYNKYNQWDGCMLGDADALLRYPPANYIWRKLDADVRIQKHENG